MTIDEDPGVYQRVIRQLDTQAVVERHWPLHGGISAQMTAVAYRDGHGRSRTVIIRRPASWVIENLPRPAQYEFDILAAVHEAGALVPEPYIYDESREILPLPYLVVEYLDGSAIFTTDDVPGYARQLAAALAQIHRIDATRPVLRDLPSHADWLNERILGDAEPDESIRQRRHYEVLRTVWPLPALNKAAVLHRDIWPGNLVWRDGLLQGVIDWEDAAIGEPLADFSVARLDLLWAFGWPMVDAFSDAYRELSGCDFSQLPYWDLVAAVRPGHELSTWATAWPVVGRDDINSTIMRQRLLEFADRALAAIDPLPTQQRP